MSTGCTRAVDPYVSGSNPADKEVAENPDLDQIAADAQVEQKSANLVASASSTRFETSFVKFSCGLISVNCCFCLSNWNSAIVPLLVEQELMGQVPEVVRLEAMEEYQLDRAMGEYQLDRAMGEYQLDRAMGEYQLDRAMGVGRSEATVIQEELVMDQAEAMEEVPSDLVQVTVVLAGEVITDHRD
jgi:hypothetical protein